MAIRFGICKDFDKLELVAKAGFDYIEPQFRTLTAMSDEEFEKTKAKVVELNIKCEAYNIFAPGSVPSLRAEDIDFNALSEMVHKGMSRAKELGGKIVVMGCGWLRRYPEDMTLKHAKEETAKTIRFCGDIAAQYGITLVIEPLNLHETNFVNTLKEGIEFTKLCDHPAVKCLVDFYHTYRNSETIGSLKENIAEVYHAHLARPNEDRAYPEEEDLPKLEAWSQLLKDVGYDSRISLECHSKDAATEEEDILRSLAYLRKYFN